jgi:hypothetical protein
MSELLIQETIQFNPRDRHRVALHLSRVIAIIMMHHIAAATQGTSGLAPRWLASGRAWQLGFTIHLCPAARLTVH